MNKPDHLEMRELDEELRHLEASQLAVDLRAAAQDSSPPPLAINRIRESIGRRMHGPAPRPGRWQSWQRAPRLLGSVGLIVALGLGLLLAGRSPATASAEELLNRAEERAGVLVEEGKVRHIVREISTTYDGQRQSHTEEIWLRQGQHHILVWAPGHQEPDTTRPAPASGIQEPDPTIPAHLIDEDHVYSWDRNGAVHRFPFAPCSLDLAQWVGDPAFLAQAHALWPTRVLGEEQIGEQLAVIVEIDLPSNRQQLWIVPKTGQIVQQRTTNGEQGEWRMRVIVDEQVDVSPETTDLFTFRLSAGTTLVEHTEPRCTPG